MRVLLVDAFPLDSPNRIVVDTALATLRDGGHEVTHRVLAGGPFEAFMSAEERRAYHGDEPLVTPETHEDAETLAGVDALLFCYPTILFTTPALLKSWMERVLVPGVAFVFDKTGRVRPGMTNIRRLGSITASPHGAMATRRARDASRRTIQWSLRLNCHWSCRRTFVRVDAASPDVARVRRTLTRW